MTLEGVVACCGGLQVAQRGASPVHDGPSLQVGDIAPVVLPTSALAVEARRQDASLWRRHWVEEARLVIDFVDVTCVEVDHGSGTVTFDRALSPDMEQHLLLDHVMPLVLSSRGALVLHGAVVSRDGAGAVLIGATGAGKSTLTAFAWQAGWTVGGDDGAVVHDTHPPTVEPTYSTIRLTRHSAELLSIDPDTTSWVAGKVRIAHEPGGFSLDPVPLRLIASIRPCRAGEDAALEPLDPIGAHALLFGSTFHAELSGKRSLSRTVEGLATIVESTVVAHLRVPRGVDGLAAAERVLRAHVGAMETGREQRQREGRDRCG